MEQEKNKAKSILGIVLMITLILVYISLVNINKWKAGGGVIVAFIFISAGSWVWSNLVKQENSYKLPNPNRMKYLIIFFIFSGVLGFIFINRQNNNDYSSNSKNNDLIVQTPIPQSNYYKVNQSFKDFYANDPMTNAYDLNEIRRFNKPFCIMQDYYDLFINSSLLQQAKSYYFDPLLIHHNDKFISAHQAIIKDIANFSQDGIESFRILVQPNDMITDLYDNYDISSTTVNFYILKTNGKQLKLSRKMYFVLNKKNTKIYGISSKKITQKNVDDVIAMISEN